LSAYTVDKTQDEFGQDRFFVADPEGVWLGYAHASLEQAQAECDLCNDPNRRYGMFSAKGNLMVADHVDALVKLVNMGDIKPNDVGAAIDRLNDAVRPNHPEVGDTAVREAIWYALEKRVPEAFNV